MKRKSLSLSVIILASFAFVMLCCSREKKAGEAHSLFNGQNLNGWDTYLGPAYDTVNKTWDSLSLGLNNDPSHVFSVVTEDGKPALHISGEHFGGISTQEEFSNYHLTLQFKWGEKKSPPNQDKKRDSGLLYHAVGPHGADFKFWMRSQEFQIQEGDCGDYWGVAGGAFSVHASPRDSGEFVYDPHGPLRVFSATSEIGRRCIKNPDAENPTGEWNTLELYCMG